MENTKEVLHAKARRKQVKTSVTVSEVLQGCGKFLTDVEYSRVDDKSKADSDSAVDELIKIFLSKEDKDFDIICSTLRGNGYEKLVAMLKEEATAEKCPTVAPRDQELLEKVEEGWNEPPKAENSPTTNRSRERTEEQSWDEGTYLESLLSNVGLKVPFKRGLHSLSVYSRIVTACLSCCQRERGPFTDFR